MYLHEISSSDFILLKADWQAGDALELINRSDLRHIIIHRSEGSATYHYLYSRVDALERLSAALQTDSVLTAFDLHETGAIETSDPFDVVGAAPDRTVIVEDNHVVGFVEPSAPERPRRTMRGGGGGTTEPAEVVPRALEADFPDEVPLDETTSLLVSLTAEAPTVSGAQLSVQLGSEIDIVVQPQKGFELVGMREGTFTVTDEGATSLLRFKLKAIDLGPGRIRVLAFQGGSQLADITLAPMVLATGTAEGQRRSHEHEVEPVRGSQPDLSLVIFERTAGGKPLFDLRLSATDAKHGLNLKSFGPIELKMSPEEYFDDFFQGIEALPLDTAQQREIAEVKLASKGLSLFQALIPDDLKERLWELKEQITSVVVESEEPWIPWELCKLEGTDNGQVVEGPFLAEAFEVTRWIPGIGKKPSLKLDNVGVVVPSDSGLDFAPREEEFMLSLANGGRIVTKVPAEFLELHTALASGEYDGWHFSGHGLFSNDDRNRTGIALEGNTTLSPDELVGNIKRLGNASPLVFLNACQIGRSELGLTDIGGFAAQFLRAGAAAFVGSYWSIYDEPALEFAKSFYARLIAGDTIGQAAKVSRAKINTGGDPTWLAYTVYADPLAKIGQDT